MPPDPPGGRLKIDDHLAPLYTVGQVADLLGVQPAFVRRLDTEEVVQPARSPGGQRRYNRLELARIQTVSQMTAEGITLTGVKRIMALQAELDLLQAEIALLRQQLDGQQSDG